MIGRTVSHDRVISHLGAGGMGTVWLAEATKLHRRAALKFLSGGTGAGDEPAARLLREARAASVLDHPRASKTGAGRQGPRGDRLPPDAAGHR